MTAESAGDVVRRYHQAWTSGDVETAMTCVADDITARVPGEDIVGLPAYREYIAGFAPHLTGLEDVASFVDGDRVSLIYYPQTPATSTAPAAEYFTVRDGKIATSVLVFDRMSFAPPA